MYILIEHDGTEEQMKTASYIKTFAEDSLGFTCEQVTGSLGEPINIYDSKLKPLGSFDSLLNEDEMANYFEDIDSAHG